MWPDRCYCSTDDSRGAAPVSSRIPMGRHCMFLPNLNLDSSFSSPGGPSLHPNANPRSECNSSQAKAYMLAVTLQGPMNGRVSDIVGRKPMLYTAILVFSIASALCGAAKSSTWYVPSLTSAV